MKWIKYFMALGILLLQLNSYAQITITAPISNDSIKKRSVPLEEVPSRSLQALTMIDAINESIITEEEVTIVKSQSDSILKYIQADLIVDENVDFDSLLSRNLVNKSKFWKRNKDLIEGQIQKTEDLISELSLKSKEINNELIMWMNTKSVMDSTLKDPLFGNSIKEVIVEANSLKQTLLDRTKVCFSSLKKLNQTYVRIDKLIQKIKKINGFRQEQVFEKTQLSFEKVVFYKSSYINTAEYIKRFIEENTTIISRFYHNQTQKFILFALYLLSLLVLFFYLKSKSGSISVDSNNIYESAVVSVLQSPISLAIILSVFSSNLFYPDRPPIVIDISILVLIIPIINIVAHLSKRKGSMFLFIFSFLILLRFLNYIFPPIAAYHRINLLLMGVLEIVFLYVLYRKLNISDIINEAFNQFVRIVILVHILASIIGIFANFTGHLMLAEIAIDLSITNTLVGLLLIISAVVLIGLIQLAISGKYLNKFRFINRRIAYFKKTVVFIVMLATSLLWVNYFLRILRINDLFYQFLDSIFNTSIALGSASFTMGGILLFVLIIWLSVVVSNMIRAILEDDVLNRVSLKKGVPRMISVVIRFSLISIGVFIAVSAVGMPLTQLTIIISAFSVGIGFGLQNVVNNFVSGIILLFERPVQIGDTVEVNHLIGNVKSMGIRSSNIRTFDGAEVIVPNANLISNEVINWTLSDKRRRIEIFSGVAYGSDVYKVKELLLEVLFSHPDILKDPEPMVLFNDLGESSLDFRLLFWTDNFDKWVIIKSEVVFGIHDALNNANIVIPFPQRDVHINYLDKEKGE